jgi:hypothetical protein
MDAAISWPNGKHYLFEGSTYQRYDAETGTREASGVPIAGAWGTLWPDGVDAGLYWGFNKAFFFKGSEFCRYDCKTDTVDYVHSIADYWPGLWTRGIEACLNWTNGKLYIFRGSEYVRWDIGFDRMDEGYPRSIAGAWPGIWEDGVDAALYPGGEEAYFFKGGSYRVFNIAADTSDGVDRPIASFAPAPVPSGLLKPARDLSREEAAKIAVWQANAGAYSFKTAWMAVRKAPDGTIQSVDANRPIAIEPRRIGRVEYVNNANRQGQTVDNLDPRMLVALERLGRWLNADRADVEAVVHMGIGHGGSNPKDCHNQGRALDLSGLVGAVDGEAFDLDVTRDWGKLPEGTMGAYRLDPSGNAIAYDLFKRAYAFGTYECECNRGNVWPPTEIGAGGFVICPDYWGDGSASNQKLRRDHNNHIHMQIGPTVVP